MRGKSHHNTHSHTHLHVARIQPGNIAGVVDARLLANVNPRAGIAIHTLRVDLVDILRHQGAVELAGTREEERH